MDDTIELVNEWAAYRRSYPNGTISEFCRHHLISKREADSVGQNFGGIVPPQVNVYLIKLIGRILQCGSVYVEAAFKDIAGVKNFNDFNFLNSIKFLGEIRKTEIINYNLAQLSSGIDIMNRLLDNGFISERPDTSDRRARLVMVTAQGETALLKCYEQLVQVNELLWSDLPTEDKKLCIQLLKGVEVKHSKLAMELKGKTFAEMVGVILGVREKEK